MNEFIRILWFKGGTSDKVYIVEVIKQDDRYITVVRHGRRKAANLNVLPKFPGHEYKVDAIAEATKLANRKCKEGYKDAPAGLKIEGFNTSLRVPASIGIPNRSVVAPEVEMRKIEL